MKRGMEGGREGRKERGGGRGKELSYTPIQCETADLVKDGSCKLHSEEDISHLLQ